jgi:hypothetical protein
MKGKERKNTAYAKKGEVGGRADGERKLCKVGGEAEEGRKISMLKRRRVKEKERQRKEESSAW